MNRFSLILIVLVAMAVAGCSSPGASATEPASASDAAASHGASHPAAESEPPESEPAASEPAETDGTGSADGPLADLIPDEIGGMSRNDVDFAQNPIFGQALAGSGVDASEVEYIISTWGDAAEVTLSSMRIPGMEQAQLEQLARLMSGANPTGGAVEEMTVGGKTVLQITGEGTPAAAYIYFADGVMFTVVSESGELSEEVLSALP